MPTLVLLSREGTTVSVSAQEKLIEDPNGTHFPWRPRPVDQVSLLINFPEEKINYSQ